MSIKILGGIAKGLSLFVPKDHSIRPTSVMLKRKIFDSNQSLEGSTLVDLCAGTGAMALEAWSRGADGVYLVEENPKIYKLLKKNCEFLTEKFPEERSIRPLESYQGDALKWLKNFKSLYGSWSEEKQESAIVFVDPPYGDLALYEALLEELAGEWYSGTIWLEGDNKKGQSEEFWRQKYSIKGKGYTHGDSFLLVLKKQ